MKGDIFSYPSVSPSLELVCHSGMCGWRVLHVNRSRADGNLRKQLQERHK